MSEWIVRIVFVWAFLDVVILLVSLARGTGDSETGVTVMVYAAIAALFYFFAQKLAVADGAYADSRPRVSKSSVWLSLVTGIVLIVMGVALGIAGDKPEPDYNGTFVALFWVGVVGGGLLLRNAYRNRGLVFRQR